jgi:hypothetical protein
MKRGLGRLHEPAGIFGRKVESAWKAEPLTPQDHYVVVQIRPIEFEAERGHGVSTAPKLSDGGRAADPDVDDVRGADDEGLPNDESEVQFDAIPVNSVA